MKTILITISLFLITSLANAQLVISNWNITHNSLSFQITGSVTTDFTPTSFFSDRLLIIGVLGNKDWINSNDNAFDITGTADGLNASQIFTNNTIDGVSDYILINFSPGLLDFQNGGSVNLTVTSHILYNNTFNPGALNPSDLIINWGYNDGYQDIRSFDTQIGSAIPEPSTYAAILGGLALVGFGYNRYRRKRSNTCS